MDFEMNNELKGNITLIPNFGDCSLVRMDFEEGLIVVSLYIKTTNLTKERRIIACLQHISLKHFLLLFHRLHMPYGIWSPKNRSLCLTSCFGSNFIWKKNNIPDVANILKWKYKVLQNNRFKRKCDGLWVQFFCGIVDFMHCSRFGLHLLQE